LKYNNDNNFSKESCIGGDIINSNVTEGLMSLPPVESRVTACHAMRGTLSARNNISREGGAILGVAMGNNDDDFSKECHIGGNIIENNVTEGLTSLPPVESRGTAYHAKSKVTACNAMPAICSARNNISKGGAILEVRQ
jgi:hypothetical protein